MKHRSRLLVWVVLALALFALYGFLNLNRDLAGSTAEEQGRVLAVLLFLAWVPAIVAIVRASDLLMFEVVASRRGVGRAPLLLRELVAVILYAIGFAWAIFSIFKYNVTTVLATGTVVAAILGLALQETLGNLFAGIALHLEDSFAPGDVIRTGEYTGIVEAVRWRGTRLRTFNNNLVIVPNSMLARERLEVFPRGNFNARVLQFAVDFDFSPAMVIPILARAASNVDGVAQEMPCIARIGGFAESSVTYEIKYFTSDYSMRDRIDSEVRRAVWYALKRNGIPLAFPVRAMHRYQTPAPSRQRGAEEILHLLEKVDILSPASPSEQQTIAEAARVREYARGETIIRHGEEGQSMFIVQEGSVSVRSDHAELARLQRGDFFGEMALLTGEERTADVVALTDVVAIEIAKDALEPVFQEHPDLAAAISARVVERRRLLESSRVVPHDEEMTIRTRIKAYFGL